MGKHFLAEIEEQILATWESEKTFEQSVANRKDADVFSFYDGPPFANGTPHYGHLEQTTIKDTVTRYKTMRGYYVPRNVGWDTHGLPVEYAIEKEHGFKGKQDIVAYGIDKFNAECRESVFKYKDIWENMFRRVGRWADFSKTYATLDESYIESVWWVFKTIHDKGLVYKAFRSSPYCPRCATPLSNFELNQGYQDNVPDPSLFVKFRISEGQGELSTGDAGVTDPAYLLGWTTTPWSLPGNAAIAVKPEAQYVYVRVPDDEGTEQTLVLARDRLEALDCDTYHIVKEVQGKELVGLSYEPLFMLDEAYLANHGWSRDRAGKDYTDGAANLYKVWGAEFVSIEDGSGVLHVAPAFGEDDLKLGNEQSIPVLITIDENGHVRSDLGLPESFGGKFFKAADKHIIEYLTKAGMVYAAETFTHTYPFCWRCDTPLLYYATDSWMVDVTKIKHQMVKNNAEVNWTPKHIQAGRFGKWLEGARDWAISRNRFWGAPLPVWVTEDGSEMVVIGSVEELKQRAVDPGKVGDLHRPYIDDVQIKTDSGKIATRIPEVFDCWFESGSMPYAQDHYPFENKEQWEERYPADFIAEAIDQTRGWFYTLHVLGSALFDRPAFQNVICSGWIVAADGEKLSKRKKNYAPMDEVFDNFGVDTMRFFMASSPLMNGEDTRFSVDFLREVQRNVFMTFNNIHSFYKLYADVDGYVPPKPGVQPDSSNVLDAWMLSRLNQTVALVTEAMDGYRLDKATRPIVELLDDASNWFVRRSRRRFWKSEDDGDKQQAYATLHYTLLTLSQLLAPFAPFLSDHIWRKLVAGTDLPGSVHLSDWPVVTDIDTELLAEMARARSYIAAGLAKRAEAKVKVRQPLASFTVPQLPDMYREIIADEMNVKEVIFADPTHGLEGQGGPAGRADMPLAEAAAAASGLPSSVVLDTTVTPELKREGLMRDVVRVVQNARKQAGLNVDDRIALSLSSVSQELLTAIEEHKGTICSETLATGLVGLQGDAAAHSFTQDVKVAGETLTISLQKA